MSNVVTVLGILVLLIGIVGLFGWLDVYSRVSGTINSISSVGQTAQSVGGAVSWWSWLPFGLGKIPSTVGGGIEAVGNALVTLALSIQLYLIYNLVQNIALIFIGIALIDLGMGHKKLRNTLKDTREYLRQEREKK